MKCPVGAARFTAAGHDAVMKQLSAAAVERGDETTGRHVARNGQADHVVSGSGDPRHQLPADAALEDTL